MGTKCQQGLYDGLCLESKKIYCKFEVTGWTTGSQRRNDSKNTSKEWSEVCISV